MLKTTKLLDKLAFSKNNNNKSVFNRNDNNKLVFRKNNSNSEVNKFGVSGMKHTKELEKLKSQKLAKFQKLSKSEKLKSEKLKELSKSKNLPNFDVIEARPSFLISNTKMAFNYLLLVFTEALIL